MVFVPCPIPLIYLCPRKRLALRLDLRRTLLFTQSAFLVQLLFACLVTALCSEGPMFRRSYVWKVLCSEGLLFRRSYVQKVRCSESSIFRRFYVQKVICSEIFVQKVLCLESTGDYSPAPIGHTTLNQRQWRSFNILISQKRCIPGGFPSSKLVTFDHIWWTH